MQIIQLFILTFLELTGFIILWHTMDEKTQINYGKIISIISLGTLVTVFTDFIHIFGGAIINIIFVMILVKLLYKKTIKYTVITFLIIYSISIIAQVILFIPFWILDFIASDVLVFKNGIVINSCYVILTILIYKYIPVKRMLSKYKNAVNKSLLILLNALSYGILIKIYWDSNNTFVWEKFPMFIFVSMLFIGFNLFFYRYSIRITEQKKIIETYHKYSPIITQLIEDVRRKQHDFKNHLNTIYGMAQINKETSIEDIQQYIQTLNGSLKNIDILIQLENKVIGGIIYSKLCEAEEKRIDFQYSFENVGVKFPMDDYELSEVLSNLLDNAFEAVGVMENCKQVKLRVGQTDTQQYIEVQNNGEKIDPTIINKMFNKGFTTKKTKGHGYGLYNIKKIVESNRGKIQLSLENECTTFYILF